MRAMRTNPWANPDLKLVWMNPRQRRAWRWLRKVIR